MKRIPTGNTIEHVVSLFGLKILNINNQEKALNFWTHLIYKLFLFYFHANLEAFKRCLKSCLEKLWRYMWWEQTKYLTAWKRAGRCPGWNRRSLYRRSEAGPLSWVHSSCLRLKLKQKQTRAPANDTSQDSVLLLAEIRSLRSDLWVQLWREDPRVRVEQTLRKTSGKQLLTKHKVILEEKSVEAQQNHSNKDKWKPLQSWRDWPPTLS